MNNEGNTVVELTSNTSLSRQKDNNATRNFLAKIDSENNNTNLVDAWDRATSFEDTNEIVRQNILKNQVLLEQAYQRVLSEQSGYEERLKILRSKIKDNPEAAFEYLNLVRENQEKIDKDRDFLMKLQQSNAMLAREYRQCALNNQWFIHVSKMQKFALGLQMIANNILHDPEMKKQFSKELKRLNDECFPSKTIEVQSKEIME